ncbi:acyl carrier protein [Escherichia coli]|uniref:acyl carrier protein n=1 Tax=Escherichia coli TaxID=562 RepID=UPI0038603100
MVNREIVMDYILSCLQDLVENGVEIKPDSDLVNDLGLESIKVMDLLMMLEDRFDISIPIRRKLQTRMITGSSHALPAGMLKAKP